MHYDILVKIKNAEGAQREQFQTDFSNLNFAIAKLLKETGYIEDVQKKNTGKKSSLEIKLNSPLLIKT